MVRVWRRRGVPRRRTLRVPHDFCVDEVVRTGFVSATLSTAQGVGASPNLLLNLSRGCCEARRAVARLQQRDAVRRAAKDR